MSRLALTFRPRSTRRRLRVHGFLARMSEVSGRRVLRLRRLKGRKRLSA